MRLEDDMAVLYNNWHNMIESRGTTGGSRRSVLYKRQYQGSERRIDSFRALTRTRVT